MWSDDERESAPFTEQPEVPVPGFREMEFVSMAGFGAAAGGIAFTTFKHRYTCQPTETGQISLRDAVREIQEHLQQCEAEITAAIESGRCYYLGKRFTPQTAPPCNVTCGRRSRDSGSR